MRLGGVLECVRVKDRVTVSEVAHLANTYGMTVEAWDDETGFYNLVRDPEPAPVSPKSTQQASRSPLTQNQSDAIEAARAQRKKWAMRTAPPAPLGSGLKIPSGSSVAPWVRDYRED
jgi:hypothetical protein